MKILITGASGLVGTALIQTLREKGSVEIIAVTSKKEVFENSLVKTYENNELENAFKNHKIDVVVNLAFPRNVKDTEWEDGISFSLRTLFFAKEYDARKVINVSSQSLYGWARKAPAKEGDKLVLNSPYTTGKCCAEVVTSQLFAPGMATSVRLATVISPTTQERVVNKFFQKIIHGENIEIQGGNQIFSFLNVKDVAEALAVMIMQKEKSWNKVYNLGTREYYTLKEIAEMMVEIGKQYGYHDTQIIVKEADLYLNNQIEVEQFIHDFNWKARYTLYDTIKEYFEQMAKR